MSLKRGWTGKKKGRDAIRVELSKAGEKDLSWLVEQLRQGGDVRREAGNVCRQALRYANAVADLTERGHEVSLCANGREMPWAEAVAELDRDGVRSIWQDGVLELNLNAESGARLRRDAERNGASTISQHVNEALGSYRVAVELQEAFDECRLIGRREGEVVCDTAVFAEAEPETERTPSP